MLAVSKTLRYTASVARNTIRLRTSMTSDIAAQMTAAAKVVAVAEREEAAARQATVTHDVRKAVVDLADKLFQARS
jgi:hypothetical protein